MLGRKTGKGVANRFGLQVACKRYLGTPLQSLCKLSPPHPLSLDHWLLLPHAVCRQHAQLLLCIPSPSICLATISSYSGTLPLGLLYRVARRAALSCPFTFSVPWMSALCPLFILWGPNVSGWPQKPCVSHPHLWQRHALLLLHVKFSMNKRNASHRRQRASTCGGGSPEGRPLGGNENKLYYPLDSLVSLIGVKLLDKGIDINMVCLHFSNAVTFFFS